MDEIYIVTTGEYSDYRICGVFTEKKLAKKFIDLFKKDGYNNFNDIEKYPINPFKFELQEGYKPYFVRMDKEGNSSECNVSEYSYGFMPGDNNIGFDIKNNIYCHVYAKDKNHALKIVNEKRGQLIANNKWK
jgi:hypothetical protein